MAIKENPISGVLRSGPNGDLSFLSVLTNNGNKIFYIWISKCILMKNVLFGVALLIILAGCKSWDASQIDPQEDPIEPKLPALERSISDYASAQIISNEDEIRIFTKEVENNLTNPYGKKYGYVTLSSKHIETNHKAGFAIFNGLLMFLPGLAGMPLGILELKMEITVKILDADRSLIGKYSAIGIGKNKIALYHGYSSKDAARKTHADCLKDGLKDIRSQILDDNRRLIKKLKEKGPM
jgi:hypothetical protein